MSDPRPTSPDGLPLRWAVIIFGALAVGVLVAALTLAQTNSWPTAVLAGLGGAGATAYGLHAIIVRE